MPTPASPRGELNVVAGPGRFRGESRVVLTGRALRSELQRFLAGGGGTGADRACARRALTLLGDARDATPKP